MVNLVALEFETCRHMPGGHGSKGLIPAEDSPESRKPQSRLCTSLPFQMIGVLYCISEHLHSPAGLQDNGVFKPQGFDLIRKAAFA